MTNDDAILGLEQRASATELRAELADRLPSWRSKLEALGSGPSTDARGPAEAAISLGNALLRSISLEFLPDVRFSARPTVGERVGKLKKNADRRILDCTELDREMLTASEIDLISEFGRNRAALAHQEDRLVEARAIGRVTSDDCLDLLDLVERLAQLPVVDEMVCRESRSAKQQVSPEREGDHATATLVINNDYSYCSACGGGASLDESAHLTLLGRETADGWLLPPEGESKGCGATFTATATDSFAKEMAEAIIEDRPDLPFLGKHGAQARD